MTVHDFLLFYPQFSSLPAVVLASVAEQASLRFTDLEEDAEEARRLYTAHKLTLYARTAAGADASTEALSAAGTHTTVASKRIGEIAVSYSNPSVSGTTGDLAATTYGIQLASLLRLASCTRYVP